jgi:hypothetical protein
MSKARDDHLRAELRAAAERGEGWAADALSFGGDLGNETEQQMFSELEQRIGAEKAARCIAEVCKFACVGAEDHPGTKEQGQAKKIRERDIAVFEKYSDINKNIIKSLVNQLRRGSFGERPQGRPTHLDEIAPFMLGTMRILIAELDPKFSETQASKLAFELIKTLCVEPDPPREDSSEYRFSAESIRQLWRRRSR